MFELDKTESALNDIESHINNVGKHCHRFSAVKNSHGKLTDKNIEFLKSFKNDTEIGFYSCALMFGDYVKNLNNKDFTSLIKLIRHGKIKVFETSLNNKTTRILRIADPEQLVN